MFEFICHPDCIGGYLVHHRLKNCNKSSCQGFSLDQLDSKTLLYVEKDTENVHCILLYPCLQMSVSSFSLKVLSGLHPCQGLSCKLASDDFAAPHLKIIILKEDYFGFK